VLHVLCCVALLCCVVLRVVFACCCVACRVCVLLCCVSCLRVVVLRVWFELRNLLLWRAIYNRNCNFILDCKSKITPPQFVLGA
jgi:hypothetical protein